MTQRKWLKTGLAVVMASVMIIAGCGSNDANNKGANSSNSGDDTAPVTFTYFSFSSNKDILASDTDIGKKLQEQTNVDWKMEFAVGDISTKSGVMITGGDYPDVIVPEGEIDKLIDAEAFTPLNDLIEKHAPNIKRVYGDYMDKFTAEDGNIYVLPFSANQGYISDPNISQGAFWIQRGVLKEFGYPEITTLDQYFDLIAQYKAKYPTVDGKDTIGFITYAGVKDNFFTITNAPMHLAGFPNDGGVTVDMETHEAKVYAASDIEKPWLQKLNEINAAGLFDPETFTANKDQYLAKLTSGRVLGYFNYGWQVGDATNNLKTAGNDDLRYVALPIVYDESITDQYIDPPAFVNNRGIGISVSAKDPVRIIKYFDNLLTEENQKLVQWGEEGVTYSVDENGRYVMNNEQIANRNDNEFKRSYGWSYFEYSWPRYGNSSVFEDGNSYSVGNQSEVAFAGYTEGDQAILNAYGVKTFAESFSEPQDRPWYPAWSINKEQGSAEQIFEQKSGDIQQKYFPKIVFATPDQFESVWNEYVAEFNKLDVAGYEAFVTNKVKERVAGNW